MANQAFKDHKTECDHLIDQLKMINMRIQNFNSFGFRKSSVFCNDNSGTLFGFIEHQLIPSTIKSCVLQLDQDLMTNGHSFKLVARVCANFWMQFIATHPFPNANRRTGIEYLQQRLQVHGYSLSKNNYFVNYKFGLRPLEDDLRNLTSLFCIDLVPLKPRTLL